MDGFSKKARRRRSRTIPRCRPSISGPGMADRRYGSVAAGKAVLQVQDLQVYYGESHALQGVSLSLERGILSVVGRNGMGKTTLCNTIVGLMRARSGAIRFEGRDISKLEPHEIARAGVGFVPQGRRLWPSLSVDETLRLSTRVKGAWTIERVYSTFPRLAERRGNGGGQISGGEQQMLAIARALLGNPRLLVMDEPTEGLAPIIVDQVEALMAKLAQEGEMAILVVEQNIGVATAVADNVAIMVNGRINRVMEARALAGDSELQQRLLGVGRQDEEDNLPATEQVREESAAELMAQVYRVERGGDAASSMTAAPARPSVPALLPERWKMPPSDLRESMADGSRRTDASERMFAI